MSIYSSIYIPRMSVDYDEESIRKIMSYYRIGTISHIDFTPINKKPGFRENFDQVVKSAFIHFSDPWLCSDLIYRFQTINHNGNYNFWDIIATGKPYKIQVSETEYWLCLKNKNPVQRTMMNIHQVVENGRHLEKLVEEQADKIKELERKLEVTHDVVYQLVGGLFCHEKQKGILDLHLDILFGREYNNNFEDTSKWTIWPTTRQGDECEKRIRVLEKLISDLRKSDSDEDQDTQLLKRKSSKL
jgi:hypothetical protein